MASLHQQVTLLRRWASGVLLAAGLTACGTVHPTLAELKAVPGATAAYPGAVEYRRVESESNKNAAATNKALIVVDACSGTDRTTLTEWFDSTLTGQGWQRYPGHESPGDPTKFEPEGIAWTQGERRFVLLFLVPAAADRLATETSHASGCQGGYETIVS